MQALNCEHSIKAMWCTVSSACNSLSCVSVCVLAVAAKDNASQDGHAPEVVPADATAKKITSSGTTNKDTQSKMEHKYKAKSGDASADAGFVQQDSNRDKAKRSTGSPLFLSPATSLNSNSSGLSRHSSGGRADFDSLAAATTAVASAAAAPVKPAAKPVLLSSAALQKMDSNHNSAKFGKKAASVKSAKSVKSDNHSRTSSVDWQDVELQSEGEGKAPAHPMGVQGRPRGVPSHLGAKGTANAALRGAETETDDGLSEAEGGGGRQGQRAGLPELPSTDGNSAVLLSVSHRFIDCRRKSAAFSSCCMCQ